MGLQGELPLWLGRDSCGCDIGVGHWYSVLDIFEVIIKEFPTIAVHNKEFNIVWSISKGCWGLEVHVDGAVVILDGGGADIGN
jgi:hypothetical protein